MELIIKINFMMIYALFILIGIELHGLRKIVEELKSLLGIK